MTSAKERRAAHAPYDDDSEQITVTMDIGVYRYLAEWMETRHKQRRYAVVVPWYDALIERAHRQFQAAVPQPEVSANGERKRVIRRVAKGKKRR